MREIASKSLSGGSGPLVRAALHTIESRSAPFAAPPHLRAIDSLRCPVTFPRNSRSVFVAFLSFNKDSGISVLLEGAGEQKSSKIVHPSRPNLCVLPNFKGFFP